MTFCQPVYEACDDCGVETTRSALCLSCAYERELEDEWDRRADT